MPEKYLIDQLLDPDNDDYVTLYDTESKEEIEFRQIAIIPYLEKLYAILSPVYEDDSENNEAFVFEINEDEDTIIALQPDDELMDKIFDIYYKLLEEDTE